MECSYQKETIKECAIHFLDLHRQVNGVEQKVPTVKRKYTQNKFRRVSLIEIPSC